MTIIHIGKLHETVAAVCPIHGVNSDGGISFADEATEAQRVAAQTAVDEFDDVIAPARELALKEIRDTRQPILFTLDGIASRAGRRSDTATATAADGAIQALLDITALPAFLAAENYDDMKAAIVARYYAIAASVPPAVQSAFVEVLTDR